MPLLPLNVSDSEIIAFVDRWVVLLEQEDYGAACDFVRRDAAPSNWTADDIREAIRRHGDRATLQGIEAGARPHVKEVTRWPPTSDGACGDVWYDLYVDGRNSDLTALFHLTETDGRVTIELIDISVR